MTGGKFNVRLILATAIIILFVIPASMAFARLIIRVKYIIKINTTRDSSNNLFFQKISEDKGILLNTNEGFLISLKTKRPVWFDMAALDGFTMVPECAEKFNSGLKEIYGVSLLEMPAKEFRNKGVLLSELHRILWETRSLDCWRTLANKYSFTGIIVPKSWKLTLPVSAENEELAYYSLKNK